LNQYSKESKAGLTISPTDLKNNFDVTALFYEIEGYKCRKYLDIKNIKSNLSQPDLMVVMMNPGSSYPIDKIDNNTVVTKTRPDNTQHQIMKVMNNCKLHYARVLNLSDIRTADSNQLYKLINSKKLNKINHSIFGKNRKYDFTTLYIKNCPTIYGWGVSPNLTKLAKLAIDSINHKNPVGLKKQDSESAYYHPLPRIHNKQLQWVEEITKQLKTII